MCIGYDPFKWADNFGSEEEYFQELEKENRERKSEDDKKRSYADSCRAKKKEY